jgi:ATP-binding cassette subfamily B protein
LKEAERVHIAWTRFWPALMLAIHLLLLGVWVLAGPRLLGKSGEAMSVGTFVSFIIYAGLFIQPIEVIGQISRMMNRAVTSAHRVFEVLDIQPGIVEQKNSVRLPSLKGGIAFQEVKFSYDGVRNVLNNVNLEIIPGEMIGLVGPTGSGKSTLIQLLMRFYDPTGGKILLDGVALGDLSLDDFRSQVGIVLQDSYLFHGSILDNIRYGRPDASLIEVIEASKAARVHDFVCKLPYGYDTRVGERGHTLSGGERQRVAIARALIQNPKVLILDEATSAVDTETERMIQEALNKLVIGRTVIAIAHRLSTLKKADRLVVLKDGEILECGTHAELLEKPEGLFRKLSQLQDSGFVSFDEVKTEKVLPDARA